MDIFLKNIKIGIELFLTISLLAMCGCGYGTHALLPPGDRTIYVENFVNKINVTGEITDRKVYYAYRPGMEADITRKVIDQFIFDGNYRIADAENAAFLLKGELVDFKREPLRYDASDNVTEYRLSVVVNIQLYDKEGKVLWRESRFAGESTYRTTGEFAKSENTAAQETMKDLATRIVERTVENW